MPGDLSVQDAARRGDPVGLIQTARRAIFEASAIASHMPPGFAPSTSAYLLFSLFVAEEASRCVEADGLDPLGNMSSKVRKRWVNALSAAGLIEQRGCFLELTADGYAKVTDILSAMLHGGEMLDEAPAFGG
ncbi:hypothetical protein GCM10009102_07560 [Sphingomonas insulae]|uniref:Winged helix DNA-binding domain-containing protein n=2 Tax=Sphingomonas insulae TaxID=424800 RepID=A0ABP3SZ51_9SPHN